MEALVAVALFCDLGEWRFHGNIAILFSLLLFQGIQTTGFGKRIASEFHHRLRLRNMYVKAPTPSRRYGWSNITFSHFSCHQYSSLLSFEDDGGICDVMLIAGLLLFHASPYYCSG